MSLKNSFKKSIALFVATSLVYSNCYLCGIGLSKVFAQSVKSPEIIMNIENSQYIQHASEKYEVVALQSKVQIGIIQEETHLPIKKTEVEVSLPAINGYLPERASIVDCDSLLTTGIKNNNKINQNYDSVSGLLSISYEGEEAYLEYTEETKDEFEIIYIYPSQAYTGNEENVELGYTLNAMITFLDDENEISSQKTESFVLHEKENKGGLITSAIKNLNNELYKGFMYSNIQNKTNYDVNFSTIFDLCVLDAKAYNQVEFEINEPYFVTNTKNNNLISSNGIINLVEAKVNKSEFDKILGQKGCIEFLNDETVATVRYLELSETIELAVIYSDGSFNTLNTDEDCLTIKFPENISVLKIKTSAPISEGHIHFENEYVINATNNYGEDVENIKGIELSSFTNESNSNVFIDLLEPQTKINVSSSNVNFSTLQKNNTTLTIGLDYTNFSTKLFDNPVIKIKLPDGLVSASLSSPQIVNANGLSIKNSKIEENYITIELAGRQVAYDIYNVSGGTAIVMDIVDIDFEDRISTHEDEIIVTCKQGEEETIASQIVNVVSKPGLLMLSSLKKFDETNIAISSMGSELKAVQIRENAQEKEAEQTIILVNNYDESIKNVEFVGRLGYTNNENKSTFDVTLSKEIEAENCKVYYSLNKDAKYDDNSWSEEFSSQAKAYRIEFNNKELALKDSIEIKQYINIPANIEFNQKTYVKSEIKYTCSENEVTEASIFEMFTESNKLLVNNVMTTQNLTNPEGQNIPVTLSIAPNITSNYVHSGQLVTYTVRVANNGEYDLNDLTLTNIIPNNAIYTYRKIEVVDGSGYYKTIQEEETKQKAFQIDVLKAGEIKEFEVLLAMSDVSEEQAVIYTAKLQVEGQEVEGKNEITLKPASINMSLTTNLDTVTGIEYEAGNEAVYYINVKNITNEKIKNINVQYELPSTLKYINGGYAQEVPYEGYLISETGTCDNNVFKYNIEKLNSGEEVVIKVVASVEKLETGYESKIDTIAKAYINGEIYESNIKTIQTKQSAFEINMSVNTNGKSTLVKDDVVTYVINVKNIGLADSFINIEDNIPEQLNVTGIRMSINGEEDYLADIYNSDLKITRYLEPNDELEIVITAKVKEIEVTEDTILEVINTATLIKGEYEITTNEVKINIKPEVIKTVVDDVFDDEEKQDEKEEFNVPGEPVEDISTSEEEQQPVLPKDDEKDEKDEKDENEEQQPVLPEENKGDEETSGEEDKKEETPTDQDEEKNQENEEPTYFKISGFAWIDENKNGQKDDNEKMKQDITVSLVDTSTGNYALDSSGNRIETKTDNEGKYEFNNIPKGTYMVLFEFDTSVYSVTTYNKEHVDNSLNSDVILSTVTIDGQQKLLALTDKIEVTSDKENISIGLIENPVFDLSLNKQITKIVVINSKGTEEYEYKDEEDIAKVDLVAKYMSGSNIIVTYKFTITNEGDVTGYVNSLVDNIPSGLEFSSELNSKWYKGKDGNLYTTSLSGAGIKPGESISVDLVLTKIMTEDNAGIFPNSAKLEKISNLESIQEKEENMENNESSATLAISIKTGSVVMYAGITTICLLIICIGIYLIKKKVLNRVI